MRIAEARRAESLTEQASATFLGNLDRGKLGAPLEADFNRLEVAALELERRVLAACSASKRCGEPAEFAGEIERLRRQAESWRAYVQAIRRPRTEDREPKTEH